MQSLNFNASPYGPCSDGLLLDQLVREQLRDVVQALHRSALYQEKHGHSIDSWEFLYQEDHEYSIFNNRHAQCRDNPLS